MRPRNCHLWYLVIIMISMHSLFAQEKKVFLQQRFDGFTEIIDKGYTRERLSALSNEFSKIGISCTFNSIVFNRKNELISISIVLRNQNNKATLNILENKNPIPPLRIGEIEGKVSIEVIKTNLPLIEEY